MRLAPTPDQGLAVCRWAGTVAAAASDSPPHTVSEMPSLSSCIWTRWKAIPFPHMPNRPQPFLVAWHSVGSTCTWPPCDPSTCPCGLRHSQLSQQTADLLRQRPFADVPTSAVTVAWEARAARVCCDTRKWRSPWVRSCDSQPARSTSSVTSNSRAASRPDLADLLPPVPGRTHRRVSVQGSSSGPGAEAPRQGGDHHCRSDEV